MADQSHYNAAMEPRCRTKLALCVGQASVSNQPPGRAAGWIVSTVAATHTGAHIGGSSPRRPDRRKVQATRPESACGSKEFNRPFPFPSRESRGGRGSPHAEARCAPAQTTVTHRCTRLPPQKGCRPLAHPLRARWSTLRRRYTTGTFYLAKKRNFLLGLDSNGICHLTTVSVK